MKKIILSIILGIALIFSAGGSSIIASVNSGPAEFVDVLIGFESVPGPSERALVQRAGGEIKYSYTLVPAIAARVPSAALKGLERNPQVTVIEPDGIFWATNYQTELDNTWGVKRIQAGIVHENSNFGAGIKVAVIDTGIDCDHRELNCAGGWNFVNNSVNYQDDNGHGTHVAGTIAAVPDGKGVVGAAPGVKLYALKVLGKDGGGSFSDVISALQWCVNEGIQVTNNSYGSSGDPGNLVKQAFDNSADKGVLHVSSAGNSGNPGGGGNNVGYPARYSSVIAVAASDSNDRRASFSSTGPDVELIAPGVSILSTLPGNSYGTYSGTSMASPHVAGVAALLWATDSTLTNKNVRQTLQKTAQDLGLSSNHQGYGLVRADLAVGADPAPEPDPEEYELIISSTAGGSVSEPGEGNFTYDEGTVVDLVAVADSGYMFVNWTGDIGTIADVNAAETTITIGGNHSITANFKEEEGDPGNGKLSIDRFDLTNTSNPAWARVTVEWAVSGTNLASVKTEMKLNGSVVGSQISSVSGSSASGTHELRSRGGHGKTYDITLTVTDADEKTFSETKNITL